MGALVREDDDERNQSSSLHSDREGTASSRAEQSRGVVTARPEAVPSQISQMQILQVRRICAWMNSSETMFVGELCGFTLLRAGVVIVAFGVAVGNASLDLRPFLIVIPGGDQ